MSKQTPTGYTSQEEARCLHKRTPEGEVELRVGLGLLGDKVSCYMQNQWCTECKKSYWVRVELGQLASLHMLIVRAGLLAAGGKTK